MALRIGHRHTQGLLSQSFYARDATTLARDLLGCHLLVQQDRLWRCRIVETEAYLGTHDLACHASKGRTARTSVMFGPAGYAYVYLIYGMHYMFNVVASTEGDPQAVLIRAVEQPEELVGRTDGPGRLCRSLGISKAHNGIPVWGAQIWLEQGPAPARITTTTRIGVAYAGDWAQAPLRFYDSSSDYVSRR